MTRTPPRSVAKRDRLRRAQQRERELTDRVLAAHRDLIAEQDKREASIALANARIAASTDRLADALIAYIDTAGVLPARAAAVLDIPAPAIVGMVRGRRAAIRRRHSEGLSNPGLEADAERAQDERGRTTTDAHD